LERADSRVTPQSPESGSRVNLLKASVAGFGSSPRPPRLVRFGLPLEKSAAFTFVSSGDLKVELRTIDLLLKDASQ
jgi:hypothetical protein